MKNNNRTQAVAQLVATIQQLHDAAQVAQEMNRTYKDFILVQSTEIEILKTNLKIKELENQSLAKQLEKRRK